MKIISHRQDFNEEQLYVDLQSIFGRSLYLKCEGFNFAGSVKLKAATEMVSAAEREGILTPGSILVESSSGNLGIALSVIAASKGYGFLCVTDPRCNLAARRLMEALGSDVYVITNAASDTRGGLLGARIDYIRKHCAADRRYVWLNQYENPGNWRAHYGSTGPAIFWCVPAARRAVHRGGDDWDTNGLRALFAREMLPACLDRRSGRRWLRNLRLRSWPSTDSRFGLGCTTEATRRGLRRRSGPRRGSGDHTYLPSSRKARICIRRVHRHGCQRRDVLVGDAGQA